MTISVVIPAYNAQAHIAAAVDSALAQTRPPREVLVVNDGSTDATRAILGGYEPRIRVLDQENRGRGAARNRGLREAAGDYVAFLDADDTLLPAHLEQLAEAAARTGAELLHDACRMPYLSEAENRALIRRRRSDTDATLLARFHFTTPNAMVRRDWILQHDLAFDETMEIGEDALFFMSMLVLGARRVYVPAPGACIGIHEANTTRDPARSYREGRAAYDALETLIGSRSVVVSPNFIRAIKRGKRHTEILWRLTALRLHPRDASDERRFLREACLRRHVALRDRVRCVLGQVWPRLPWAKHPRVMQALFGYTILRTERE